MPLIMGQPNFEILVPFLEKETDTVLCWTQYPPIEDRNKSYFTNFFNTLKDRIAETFCEEEIQSKNRKFWAGLGVKDGEPLLRVATKYTGGIEDLEYLDVFLMVRSINEIHIWDPLGFVRTPNDVVYIKNPGKFD